MSIEEEIAAHFEKDVLYSKYSATVARIGPALFQTAIKLKVLTPLKGTNKEYILCYGLTKKKV